MVSKVCDILTVMLVRYQSCIMVNKNLYYTLFYRILIRNIHRPLPMKYLVKRKKEMLVQRTNIVMILHMMERTNIVMIMHMMERTNLVMILHMMEKTNIVMILHMIREREMLMHRR